MKKYDEVNQARSTFNKIDDSEMMFILRAQDTSAPQTIIHWVEQNFVSLPDDKIREAVDCALQMRKHQNRKAPD